MNATNQQNPKWTARVKAVISTIMGSEGFCVLAVDKRNGSKFSGTVIIESMLATEIASLIYNNDLLRRVSVAVADGIKADEMKGEADD